VEDLLFLSQRIPYPPDKGDKIRSFHILRHLAERYRVNLGCFFDDPNDAKYIAPLQDICGNVFAVHLPASSKRVRALGGFARGTSFSEACFRDARMTRWVAKTLRDHSVSKGFVFSSAMAPYLAETPISKIVDIVDVDSEKWRVYAAQSSWPMNWIYGREAAMLLSLERRSALAFDKSIFVSSAEADVFLSLAPETSGRVLAMNNGVDTDYFDPAREFSSPFESGIDALVFTGTMNYRPNIEAVASFARDVFPGIRRRRPNAEFWIVGAHPSPDVRALKRDGVHVTGQVEDVRPFLAHAACVVAPLKIARGVQNKVLEAMAMARPVVVSPEAREGIEARARDELLIADTPDIFEQTVGAVLAGNYPGIGLGARAYVLAHHGWRHNLELLDTLFPVSAV
jgi:sugar transferase (PEP-CTERM/EpsH1 system associated)